MCDEGEQAKRKWTDEEIGEALEVHRNTEKNSPHSGKS